MTTRREFAMIAAAGVTAPLVLSGATAAQGAGENDGQGGPQLDRAQVEAWLAAYGTAWVERDADKAAALFSKDATYHEKAFEPVMTGQDAIRDYWQTVTADQRDITFRSTLWSVSDTVAIAHWAAELTLASAGKQARLDGVFHLTFATGSDPLVCTALREWWFFAM
ncbi:nuclear transport factor 2 family protein [Microbaculum marinum]|uniref:Nuclear transport factor 2 family protein n=1 Tax=Microbaculum marinum TaxID=1764581 RepID=A0AAW9RFK2_9HYPH